MSVNFKNDEELIRALEFGGKLREDAMVHIFIESGIKKRIANYISYKGGQFEDVNDILMESFLIFDHNIRYHKFKKQCSLSTYLFSIAKLYWLGKIREDNKTKYYDEMDALDGIENLNAEWKIINDETKIEFNNLLDTLSKKCKQILKYWSLSLGYKEIARELDLKNEATARKQKHLCQKKLAEHVRNNPQLMPTIYYE